MSVDLLHYTGNFHPKSFFSYLIINRACAIGNEKTVLALLAAGANINTEDQEGIIIIILYILFCTIVTLSCRKNTSAHCSCLSTRKVS